MVTVMMIMSSGPAPAVMKKGTYTLRHTEKEESPAQAVGIKWIISLREKIMPV